MFLISLLSLLLSTSAHANHWQFGAGPGATAVLGGSAFEKKVDSGLFGSAWLRRESVLGKCGAEVGYDFLKLPGASSNGHVLGVGMVKNLWSSQEASAHALLGMGFARADKASRPALKARLGIDRSFIGASRIGVALNYHLLAATKSSPVAHLLSPMVFLGVPFGSHSEMAHAVSAPAHAAPAESDSDEDGVVDSKDKCPGTPSGETVNSLGCSADKKVEIKLEVVFAKSQAKIDPRFSKGVSEAAALLKEHSDIQAVIEGHTDSSGNALSNKRLSQQRADAVKAALVSEGVAESRLQAMGFGSEKPVSDEKSAAGRAANRRVIMRVR